MLIFLHIQKLYLPAEGRVKQELHGYLLWSAHSKNVSLKDLKTWPLVMGSYSCNRNETETVAPSCWLFCVLKPLHLRSGELLWAEEILSPRCVILQRMSWAVCATLQLLWQPHVLHVPAFRAHCAGYRISLCSSNVISGQFGDFTPCCFLLKGKCIFYCTLTVTSGICPTWPS